MRGIKTSFSVPPVLSTLWFGALAGLLIEINRLFPDALSSFHFVTSECLYTTLAHGEN
jgi:photosystem I subunit IX